jgi:hypothetical protein
LLIQATINLLEQRRQREVRDAVLFARRAGLELDPWQADLLRSDARQMILLCSRQSGKSTVTSVLALHEAIYNAPALVLLLSPSLRQSQELFAKIKASYDALVDAPRATQETALQLRFDSGSRIVALPGKAPTVRGFSGAALLVIDEASWVTDDLYQAVRPMIAVSGGRLALLSTPFGKRGFFHHEWTEGGPDWHRAKVTAYQCPRMSKEWLDAERERIGDWWFKQEYLCEFLETLDQVFAYDDIQRALDNNIQPLFGV